MTRNVHPADRLAEVREQMKALTQEEKSLKDELIGLNEFAGDSALRGSRHEARIVTVIRHSLDMEALKASLGADVLDPFMKPSSSTQVRVKEIADGVA